MQKLDIQVQNFKRVDLVIVAGRVDSSNAHRLDDTLKELAEQGRYNLVLDLASVEYMSSAGLRALVSALRESKRQSGDVRLTRISDRVSEVLDLAGVASLFEKYDDPVAAVGSF